ncbi:MAG TPA: right-handed parallel beta-helix repeat-containing protein, partial [Spirochaetia bacterium]|nr:right-handed parallel beta-helix repeat-containing protein [Spirochaetia bacterium]
HFRNGERDSVSAAWYGFDPDDSTGSLQASLDSGARIVLVPAMGKPWVTQPLSIRSGTTMIFQEGVEVHSKQGAFRRGDDSLLGLKNVEGSSLYGYGARLIMRKADYRKRPYDFSEWRHGIEMYGCADVSVRGLSVESSGGDGVYLGRGERTYNKGIVLKDLLLRDNYRQGISIISAEDVLIENVEMSFTEGTLPGSGIDFEPNAPDERLVRLTVRRCISNSNAGAGISVILSKYDLTSPQVDIRVEDSFIANNLFSLLIWGAGKAHGTVHLVRSKLHGLRIVGPGSNLKIEETQE